MQVELVRCTTREGLRLDGALAERDLPLPLGEGRGEGGSAQQAATGPHPNPLPRGEGTEPTAAILLHGVAGNFYTSSTFEPLLGMLQQTGIAALSVNTRGHDSVFGARLGTVQRRLGAAYETVDDCRSDIAAWIEFLVSRGHEQVVLIGHSLGAIKAVYAQAREQWPQVAAVVAVSPPRLSYSAFMNSAESSIFWESLSTAERMVAEGRGEELFTGKFPFPILITAAGYIDKYGPAERYNILRFAADVVCPILFIYGSKELAQGGIAFGGLPDALLSLDHSERRTVRAIGGADHVYTGVSEALAAEIASWLGR